MRFQNRQLAEFQTSNLPAQVSSPVKAAGTRRGWRPDSHGWTFSRRGRKE
jgi:hypothetical protein